MKKTVSALVSAAMLACLIPATTSFAADVSACEFAVTADKAVIHAGDTVTFTLTVTPTGDLYGVAAFLDLPEGLTFESAAVSDDTRTLLGWDMPLTAPESADSSFSGGTAAKPYTESKPLVLGTFTCKAEDTFAAGDVGVTDMEANNSDYDSISADKMTVKPAKVSVAGLKKIDAKDSDCKVKGNNEYYICECGQADCDRVYKKDQTTKTTVEAETLPLADHKFTSETVDAKYLASAATCAAPAKYFKSCAVCGEKGTDTFESGAKDPDKHGNNTEVRGKLEATETAEGYTGDTYCKDCTKLVTKGTAIPKLETSKPGDSSSSSSGDSSGSTSNDSSSSASDSSSGSTSGDSSGSASDSSSGSASGNSSGSASGGSSDSDNSGSNPSTGIALAITPVILITGAAMIIAKGKKK